MECIILAGGLGTRLQPEVKDVPKCMAPINGRPFLEYIFDYLERQFVDYVILSLGHKHRMIFDWLNGKAFTFKIHKVVEQEPMGTGGGVKLALEKAYEAKNFIINGDTLFDVDLRAMHDDMGNNDIASVALKPMIDFKRYGAVQMNKDKRITKFAEKRYCEKGLINGGVYLLNSGMENFYDYPEKFSFEHDFLERQVATKKMKGFKSDGYFIDIGIPEDYKRAQQELKDNFLNE